MSSQAQVQYLLKKRKTGWQAVSVFVANVRNGIWLESSYDDASGLQDCQQSPTKASLQRQKKQVVLGLMASVNTISDCMTI